MAAGKKGGAQESDRDPVPFKKFRYFNDSANTVTVKVTLRSRGQPVPGYTDVPLQGGQLLQPGTSPTLEPQGVEDVDQVVVRTTIHIPYKLSIAAYSLGTINSFVEEAEAHYTGGNSHTSTPPATARRRKKKRRQPASSKPQKIKELRKTRRLRKWARTRKKNP